MKRTRERGQVLVLFVGGMFGLLAIAALAIDLSSVYSTQQTEKAATDAAALAGAQQLGIVGTQSPTVQASARAIAWATLVGRFGIAGSPACNTSSDNSDCALPGTGYHAFISTPAKTTPTNQQSLQVTLMYPNFQLGFARLFGQNGWNVGEASVAVNDRKHSYAVITLQPPKPKPNGTDANLCKDIEVNGTGTILNVVQGDIGTNTSATTTNSGQITLAPGYVIDHVDDIPLGGCSFGTPDATWSQDLSGNPPGNHIGPSPLLQDPQYPIADFKNASTFTQASGAEPCPTGSTFPNAATVIAYLTPPAGGTLTCYRPGIYTDKFSLTSNKDIAYLMPGAYMFSAGMKLGGTLAGGLIDGKPGVVLVFPQTQTLNPNNTVGILLNVGSSTCLDNSCRATPTVDFADLPKEIKSTPDGLTITIEVPRDGGCFSGTNPIIDTCSVTSNNTISLAGQGILKVSGVIYGPSDNMSINGGSAQTGLVGQIISWTVTYTGHATLNQEYPFNPGIGILRLDRVCSGGDTPCAQ